MTSPPPRARRGLVTSLPSNAAPVAKGGHGRPRPAVAAVGGSLRGAAGAVAAPAGERRPATERGAPGPCEEAGGRVSRCLPAPLRPQKAPGRGLRWGRGLSAGSEAASLSRHGAGGISKESPGPRGICAVCRRSGERALVEGTGWGCSGTKPRGVRPCGGWC